MAYLPLSTANLPDPVIDPAQGASPEDYFGIDIYTGNGGTIDSDFGFDCDLVWYKNRSRANTYHYLFDQVRGDDLPLYSNDTFSEDSQFPTYHTQSFITNGSRIVRTIGDHLNFSGDSYVAWAWKANGSGVSNNAGSIPSTVSANTTSGFSIVTFSGDNSGGTVGHGIGSAPDWIVFMRRDASGSDHIVYHSALGATQNLRFNNTDAVRTDSTFFLNTEPTSSVFTIGGTRFASGRDYVAYCFSGVEGFSKFGSYVGNGSTDGPFVYTGFRPAFVLFKKTNITTASWAIRDNTRYTYNPTRNTLYPDKSDAEYTGTAHDIDFLSNGFKPRTTDGLFNSSGATYIYMAFAENPFKFSTAS